MNNGVEIPSCGQHACVQNKYLVAMFYYNVTIALILLSFKPLESSY